jgi:ribonucleoside-diphosphate reductase alpha chain
MKQAIGESSGYHRMGANVPNKVIGHIRVVRDPADTKLTAGSMQLVPEPPPPSIAATLLSIPGLTAVTARQQGFTGNQCTQCNSMRMRVAGHCEVCEECGSSSSCS